MNILCLQNKTNKKLDFTLLEERTPLKFHVDYKRVMVDIQFEEFLAGRYGLKDIKKKIRPIVPPNTYHAVFLIYEADVPEGTHAWTYPNPVHKSEVFIEVPAVHQQWYNEVVVHEMMHGLHRTLWWKGVRTEDTMDNYLLNLGGLIENINTLSPHWGRFTDTPVVSLYRALIASMRELSFVLEKRLSGQPRSLHKLSEWADAIQEFEGWKEGSRSHRNNNPGNLRWSPFQTGRSGGFAVFPNYEEGRKALIHQLQIAADGRSKVYSPEDTLIEFFEKYAPSSDNNEPLRYAEFVSQKVGVSLTLPIKHLL